MKKYNNSAEVAEIREKNKPTAFNLAIAIEALNAAPKGIGCTGKEKLIIEDIKSMIGSGSYTIKQILSGLKAGYKGNLPYDEKVVRDVCWRNAGRKYLGQVGKGITPTEDAIRKYENRVFEYSATDGTYSVR